MDAHPLSFWSIRQTHHLADAQQQGPGPGPLGQWAELAGAALPRMLGRPAVCVGKPGGREPPPRPGDLSQLRSASTVPILATRHRRVPPSCAKSSSFSPLAFHCLCVSPKVVVVESLLWPLPPPLPSEAAQNAAIVVQTHDALAQCVSPAGPLPAQSRLNDHRHVYLHTARLANSTAPDSAAGQHLSWGEVFKQIACLLSFQSPGYPSVLASRSANSGGGRGVSRTKNEKGTALFVDYASPIRVQRVSSRQEAGRNEEEVYPSAAAWTAIARRRCSVDSLKGASCAL